jgi:hypothetical protein
MVVDLLQEEESKSFLGIYFKKNKNINLVRQKEILWYFILSPLIAREAEYKFLLLLFRNERVLWVDI